MKGNTASMIALIVAMLVLIVVGGNSYNNYLRTQYEKEYGVLEKNRVVANTNANANPATGTIQQGGADAFTSTLDPGAGSVTQPVPFTNTPGPSQPNQDPRATQSASAPPYRTGTPPPALGGAQASTLPPAPTRSVDPEVARLQARLAALEQESSLYQQKLNQAKGGGAVPTARTATPVESGSLREVMNRSDKGSALAPLSRSGQGGQSGNSANTQNSSKAGFETQIKNAPSAAKVLGFNSEWGFVQIDAGKDRNISIGTRFAVRRGVSIVGYVKVTEVSNKMSIAELTSRNEFSETARKPKPGDDIITWPLF